MARRVSHLIERLWRGVKAVDVMGVNLQVPNQVRKTVSGNRTRGLLRAAALLAVGATPLLASAANAAEVPTDIADGKFGSAPEVGLDAAKPVTDLLGGESVKLPVTLPGGASDVRAPQVAAPTAVQAPTVPQVPRVEDALAPQSRTLPEAPALPALAPLVSGPAQTPDLTSQLGGLPVPAAPGIG